MVDALTVAINSLNIEFITLLAYIIDNTLTYIIIVSLLILFVEKNNEKRWKLFTAVILAFIIGWSIKEFTGVARPCDELVLKGKCDTGYSFPSLHAIIAFTVALGFLDEKKFIGILIFALFVAFTRIYLGVHTFVDISAALALSPIVYGLVDIYWKRIK